MSEDVFMVQLSLCISSPFTRCFFSPMYCLHIIAKGVRKERRFKEGHDASKFPISLRFFCRAVLLGPLPVLQVSYFCSVHGALWAPRNKCVVFSNFSPFFFFLSVFLSLVFPFQLFITFPHTSIYWRHFKVSANWMLPGQENNRSPAICWKDLAAAGFHIRPAIWKQTAQFISALKALWLGQWLLNFGLHTSHFFFRQISFLPWVSLWFPCLFAGRWCHPVSE